MATEQNEATGSGLDVPQWTGSTNDRAIFVIGIALALVHVYFNIFGVLSGLWRNAIHFAGFAFLCALIYPAFEGRFAQTRAFKFLDVAFGLLVAGSALYLIAAEDAVYARGVRLSPLEWTAGGILILGALEYTRRTTGIVIPVLIVLALTYVSWWGQHISGVFRFGGLSVETILFRSIYGDDGIFGNIASISSSFVFMFILLGAFLLRSGGGAFVIDLARSVAGRLTGGPGLVAVLASGLTGTISGSAVANTASTGVITIPLMKRAGFPPKFAAAVEASASTGGQLMPPIMGAGAFVIASYTQIPYTTIVAVSVLPAILYFASIAFYVRIEAKRQGVQAVEEDVPGFMDLMLGGGLPFLIPIGVLIALLIYGYTPTYAAGIAILAVIAASWLTRNPMGPVAVLEAMALGARNMVMTAVLLCSVGLIVNVIAMSGVGNTFSLMITQWAGDSLIIAMVLIALASLVLGMGLPVTAAYIVLGTLSAPALFELIANRELIEALMAGNVAEEAKAILMLASPETAAQLGTPMSAEAAKALLDKVPGELIGPVREALIPVATLTYALLSAHLIIFWLSQDSNVTPPVCLTAFTAAAIAGTPPMATGLTSWKIAKGLYLVPLLFAYTPFIGGDIADVLRIFGFALVGLYAFSGAMQGHLEAPVSWPLRIALGVCGALLLLPLNLYLDLAALAAFAAILTLNVRSQKLPYPV
ncbi:MAG: C4-dicarboxylate ABC transporter permease [Alphaproteobacteria bacterium BRH_c36]|nr:MAG: C4-dicarboxylate ABC transporter permease [Alphaproteobacteria bacterium BRH_c36]